MDILLRSAHEVSDVFAERLRTRAKGELALAVTMSVDFADNALVDTLVEEGVPGDIFAVDYFGHDNGSSALWLKSKAHQDARSEFEDNFAGSYVILNEPEREKFYQGKAMHRSHLKAFAVGSRILSAGGVNATNYANTCVDVMLDFESQELVDFLAFFIEQSGDVRYLKGSGGVMSLAEQGEVLVDWGKDGESLIMDSIFKDLRDDDVSSVVMSSSYAPSGLMEIALRRIVGLDGHVTIYTNSLTKFRKPNQAMGERKMQRLGLASIALGNFSGQRLPILDCLPDNIFNHLKAIIIEKKNGYKVAYIGSHNYHTLSVTLGTAELAVRTTNSELISKIESFIADNLTPSDDRPPRRLFGLRDVAAGISPI